MTLMLRNVPQALMVLREMPLCADDLSFDRYSILFDMGPLTTKERKALDDAIAENLRTLAPLAVQYRAFNDLMTQAERPLRDAYNAALAAILQRPDSPARRAEERAVEEAFEEARQALFEPLHALGAKTYIGAHGKDWYDYLADLDARGFNELRPSWAH